MDRMMEGWSGLRRLAQSLGPYLMLEIVMPGGTLLALLLFLYQRRKFEAAGASRVVLAARRTFASLIDQGWSLWRPC